MEMWRGIGKFVEEMGEVQQILGKLIPFPDGAGNLRDRLSDELGDLLAAIEYFIDTNNFPRKPIHDRKAGKLQKFKNWGLTGISLPNAENDL